MKKSTWACVTFLAAGVSLLSACGSSSSSTPAPGNGTLVMFIGDAPGSDVLSFKGSMEGLTLTNSAGTATGNLLGANGAIFIKVEFTDLAGTSSILHLTSLTEGTYTQATINLTSPSVTVYDITQSPPINTTVSLTSPKGPYTFNIQPPLVITKSKVSGISLDLDLRHSLSFGIDSSGKLTANFNPQFVLTSLTPSTSAGFGQTDGVNGIVTRVDTFTSTLDTAGHAFCGDFALQLFAFTGGAAQLNSNLPSASPCPKPSGSPPATVPLCIGPSPSAADAAACPSASLSTLLTGSFVEMLSHVDSNANLVANFVQVEDQENIGPITSTTNNTHVAMIGTVLSVPGTAFNPTQFQFFVRQVAPDNINPLPGTVVAVSTTCSRALIPCTPAEYQLSFPQSNFLNLPFTAGAVAPGQVLVIHGVYALPPTGVTPAPLTAVQAGKVFLKLHAYGGNFNQLLAAQSDDRTGGFLLRPGSSLFAGSPVYVVTNGSTSFQNVNGLNELTPQNALLVRGALSLTTATVSANGITVPQGAYILLAKQVEQVQ